MLKSKLNALKIIITLDIRWSKHTSELFSFLLLTLGLFFLPFKRISASNYIMRSHRNTRKTKRKLHRERLLNRFDLYEPEYLDAQMPPYDPRSKPVHPSWILKLKEPRGDEKGVLLIKFHHTFEKLYYEFDIAKMIEEYYLVLEPSWSGLCVAEVLQFLRYPQTKFIVMASEPLDYEYLLRLNSNLVPVNFGPQDWNDDRVFHDIGLEREYDCLMVAMWREEKRHHALLRAVARINDPGYRVALVGADWDMTEQDIRDLIAHYGVEQNVTIFNDIGHPEVNDMYNKAKVNVLLSMREGSNKSCTEGLFTNTPGIVLRDNLGVNKAYFNDQTGALIDGRDLADTLVHFRDHYRDYKPREWAMKHISCPVSSAKLEKALVQMAHDLGHAWTQPIAIKVNKGSFPAYYEEGVDLTPFDMDRYRKPEMMRA